MALVFHEQSPLYAAINVGLSIERPDNQTARVAAIAAVAKSCPEIWGLKATWRPFTPLRGATAELPSHAWCAGRAFSTTAAR